MFQEGRLVGAVEQAGIYFQIMAQKLPVAHLPADPRGRAFIPGVYGVEKFRPKKRSLPRIFMKTVIVRPERGAGCLQSRLAGAVEHSRTKGLTGALAEAVRPKARRGIYPGRQQLAFPDKCCHCDPAPCQQSAPVPAMIAVVWRGLS